VTDTYKHPEHGWTCFHCGETFTTVGGARDHFGADITAQPGCLIRVQLGNERGLLMELRKVEAERDDLRKDVEYERTSITAYMERLKTHLNSFKPFRECHTIQDVFNVYDSMEGRALAAEESLSKLRIVTESQTLSRLLRAEGTQR
jgi:hypothetical protein